MIEINSESTKPAIAYLTTAYPNVSHTFIRREILGLESIGYRVFRVAIRSGDAIVDPLDQVEEQKTLHLLEQPKFQLIWQILGGLATPNLRVLRGISSAWELHMRSERGVLRHIAYLVEALAFLNCLHRQRIDHVHVHFGTNAAAVAMLARLMGGPSFSMTIHGPDEFDAPIGLSLAFKMKEAAFTVAISNYCASQLRRWLPYTDWQKLHVVRCTVGDEWFAAARPVDEDASAFVSVGRLTEQKGQLLLIDAYADACNAGLRANLVLIGDGELRDAITQRIRAYGLVDRVTLTGWLDSDGVRTQLLEGRALVLPSFAEGLPVVLMEAMALMRPVLTTYIAGIPELVRHGENGWLVVAGNRAELAGALLLLDRIEVDELRDIGRRGQQCVRNQHTLATELEALHRLFACYVHADAARPIDRIAE